MAEEIRTKVQQLAGWSLAYDETWQVDGNSESQKGPAFNHRVITPANRLIPVPDADLAQHLFLTVTADRIALKDAQEKIADNFLKARGEGLAQAHHMVRQEVLKQHERTLNKRRHGLPVTDEELAAWEQARAEVETGKVLK